VGYREFPVPVALTRAVEAAWAAGVPAGAAEAAGAVLPDGCMDIVWTGAELRVAGPDTAPHPSAAPPVCSPAG
jgi:hypothetical protein